MVFEKKTIQIQDSKVGTLDKCFKVQLFMTSFLLKKKHAKINLAGSNNIHFLSNSFLSFEKTECGTCCLHIK